MTLMKVLIICDDYFDDNDLHHDDDDDGYDLGDDSDNVYMILINIVVSTTCFEV